jgi:hypothetical protein
LKSLLVLIFLSFNTWAAPTPPGEVPGGTQTGLSLRAFGEHEAISYFLEGAAIRQTAGREFKSISLGSYFHALPWLKVGALAGREFGLRHDEDWFSTNGQWAWNDSNSRGETVVSLDVTGQLPMTFNTELFLAELKLRYEYNSFNDNRTLLVRPGLSYFYFRGDELFATVFLRLEGDFPLNYGTQVLSEKWIYLGALYHLNDQIDLGPIVTEGWQTWGRPAAYAAKGGAPFTVTTQTTTFTLSSVLHF